MGLLEESVRDCNRALVLFPCYGKAWYHRGRANLSLGNHSYAIKDMSLALTMEKFSAGRRQVESELQVMRQNYKNGEPCSSSQETREVGLDCVVETSKEQLHIVTSLDKGRGLISQKDIFANCLVHSEVPYATVIFKHYRETHCHFCFRELPVDVVPCASCKISMYCSESCHVRAGGKKICSMGTIDISSVGDLSGDLIQYISDINLFLVSDGAATEMSLEQFPEHRHECLGVNWPAVLPVEIVLAGRIVAHSLEKEGCCMKDIKFRNKLDLCHHYLRTQSEQKLEWLIYSIVLMYCLKVFYISDSLLTGSSVSQLVILMAQINVNSMAIVHINSSGTSSLSNCLTKHVASAESLTRVEQVKVGQAVYLKGSLFNHSCQPNVHTYFLSRTLFVRATEYIPAGSPLEISYGPELGKQDLQERQQLLASRYNFICQCRCCSQLNFSDLVLHAFRCVRSDCFGAVLHCSVVKYEKFSNSCAQKVIMISQSKLGLPVCKQKRASINKVASLLFDESQNACQIDPGCCLNCGSYRDLAVPSISTNKIKTDFERLQRMTVSTKVTMEMITEALKSLGTLRSTMHPYSKDVAQAEDHIAEAFCSMGKPEAALPHCKASIKVVENLYASNHIAVANEFMKLATLHLTMDDSASAMDVIKRVMDIFMLFYGSHYRIISPYLENLLLKMEKFPPDG
ncbi:uncharacterized protein LOC116265681 isoform X2 [Nymphaea colorata]|nr:uncharacterized protein LOC116265681 isoform X2 [Nymphaea colorata]